MEISPVSHMNRRVFFAELLGTFALAYVVRLSLIYALPVPITPLLAALTLGLFVAIVGPISGCHINPAVTIGLLSVRKIKAPAAVLYIAAQLLGACIALLLSLLVSGTPVAVSIPLSPLLQIFGEFFGAYFFLLTIGSVVDGRISHGIPLAIGSGLLFGILVASPFSAGILNPAVAVALSPDALWVYLLAPIAGGIAGAWTSKLFGKK